MKKILVIFMIVIFSNGALPVPGIALVPAVIHFQGYLSNSQGEPVNGLFPMTFTLYDDPAAGTSLWTEAYPQVKVTRGVYHVNLGEWNPLSLPFDRPYYLAIQIDQDAEMIPRLPLNAQAFCFRSRTAQAGGGWVDSGATVTLATNTDRVGIGTADPQAALHVKGGQGNAWIQGIFESADSSGGLGLVGNDRTTLAQKKYSLRSLPGGEFVLYDDSALRTVFLFDYQGKLGIGGILPTSKLDVTGDLHSRDKLVFTDVNGTPYPENWIGMAENIDGSTRWLHLGGIRSGGVRRLALFGDFAFFNGFVGLGPGGTNPSERLQINGSLKLTGADNGIFFPDGTKQTTSTNNGPGSFPRPTFDSGWNAIGAGGSFTLTHNVGDDVDKYIVDLQFKQNDPPYQGIHNKYIGGDTMSYFVWLPYCGNAFVERGAYYNNLTTTTITVTRGISDTQINEFRVLIWLHD